MKTDLPEVKGKADIPGFGGKVGLKADVPEVMGSADVPGFDGKVGLRAEVPEMKGSAGIPGFEGKIGFGADAPEVKGSVDIPGFGIKSDGKSGIPVFKGRGDSPGSVGKIDFKMDAPSVKGDLAGFGGQVDSDLKFPDVKGSSDDSRMEGRVAADPGMHVRAVGADFPVVGGSAEIKITGKDAGETDGLKTKIPSFGIKGRTPEAGVSVSSEAPVPDVKVRTSDQSVDFPEVNVSAGGRGSRKKRGRHGRKKGLPSEEKPEDDGDKKFDAQGNIGARVPELTAQVRVGANLPDISGHGGIDVSAAQPDVTVRSKIPKFTGVSRVEDEPGEGLAFTVQPSDSTVSGSGGYTGSQGTGIPVLSGRLPDTYTVVGSDPGRPQGEGVLQGNIPAMTVQSGTPPPVGWVIPQPSSQPVIGQRVVIKDGQQYTQDIILPHTQGVTELLPGQVEFTHTVASDGSVPGTHSREYTISTEAERAQDVDSYIKGRLGPFKLTPERTLSECKTEVTVEDPHHGPPSRPGETRLLEMRPDTAGEWTRAPYTYQVRMETDSQGRILTGPEVAGLESRVVPGEDVDSRGGKQSRTVFVTEDAGGRVVVHRRMESSESFPPDFPAGQVITPTTEGQTVVTYEQPITRTSTVTTSEWPENITTHRTVRVRKIRKVKVGDGPEETIVETEYETPSGQEIDTSRLGLDGNGVLQVTPGTGGDLSHLPPELRENSLLRFGLDQREVPGDTQQTVTTTVKRIPVDDLGSYLPEGFDENLHRIMGATATTTTTTTVRKVKVIRDESGNIVEYEEDDGDLDTLSPDLTSGGVTTTTTTDGGTTTTTRVIRERRVITSDPADGGHGEALAVRECEGGVVEEAGDISAAHRTQKLANFFKMGVQDGAGVVTREPQAQVYSSAPVTSSINSTSDSDAKGTSISKVSSGAGMGFTLQQPQVRVLTLNHEDHLDSTLFRLQKGWVLQLRPGPSLLGKAVSVFTNHPEDIEEGFTRTRYRRLQWKSDSRNKGDDTALYVEVIIIMAGSFHYYFTYEDGEDREKAQGSGFFLVDPTLLVGTSNEVLNQDCVQCQTVLSKCLGPFPDWEQRLQVGYETGYNLIHFTPIQELGDSNSSYSLKDQHSLNTEFHTPDHEYTFDDVETLVKKMKDEWKMLSLTDIVLNHTANDSPWLQEHPEATYNCNNSPYLRPAYLLDRVLRHMTLEVIEGKWEHQGIPVAIREEKHLEAIKNALHSHFLPQVKLHEFYLLDIDRIVEEYHRRISGPVPSTKKYKDEISKEDLVIIQDPQYGRKTCTIDMNIAVRLYNLPRPEAHDEEDRIVRCCAELRHHLENLNEQRTSEIQAHLIKAVDCCLGTIRYQRLQPDGPMIAEVSEENPLVPPYFTHYGEDTTLEEEEALMFGSKACFLMAHNGWVIGDDPLKNFARKDSYVYLRRELVAWGDSVKLRYGEKPEDSPYLWDHMKRYCEYTAQIFHGIRLDNCHSTPIHVAEYMLDAARKVRPDLYVIAELFTNSDLTDNIFVNRLGLNSLIREAMSAPNSHEEGRLVYRYGGEPVGAFLLPPVRPLVPSIAHAIFLDLTHDNRSPAEVRTAWDMLPSTALVSMACCASGSNRGYDELIPHHIHVVDETRVYMAWNDTSPTRGEVNEKTGIIQCKKLLNKLHYEMGANGYNQVFVDQVTEHIVTVTRHNPVTHQSVVLVAYTSFRPPSQVRDSVIRPLKVQGRLEEIIFEMQVKGKKAGDEDKPCPGFFTDDSEFINGLTGFTVEVKEHLSPGQSTFVKVTSGSDSETTECEYTPSFTPGSVIAFRLSLLPRAQSAVNKIRGTLSEFGYKSRISEVTTHNSELTDIVNSLSLADLNRVLYRCDEEEKDEGRSWAVYNIPNFSPLLYCGLQGVMSVLSEIRVHNDLGHPLCGNLRDGDWLPDFIVGRLKLEQSTQRLATWLEEVFGWMKDVPRYLIPAYFDSVVTSIYLTLINRAWSMMGEFIAQGSDFAKALGLCSVQFCGVVKSSLLPPLSPNLTEPQPPVMSDGSGGQMQMSTTIAAGLPHFSIGYMRNWGRDTFIALPGNLLITGRYNEARWIILGFAGTLRHGLIPNLLDGGKKARFNCRDAIWFWLQAIQSYVTMAPNGYQILKDKVSRLYPTDDSPPEEPGKYDQLLEDVIQEALQCHFQGVKFRERNAGFQIDREMSDEGFNNQIGVDLETGFVYGGNVHNCGTWMDKMGSSEVAGTKGKPATPRDGSAVEIIGLSKSALRFLGRMHHENKFSYNSVERQDDTGNWTKWTYEFWEKKIHENFEKYFWISEEPTPEREPKPELINRRGIYKDSHNATQFWADYQLRCNYPIAIAVAPEMVTPRNAWVALKNAEKILMGPLGIKTLDPKDWAYNGNYDNSDRSSDPKVAHGYNYHQGPEWLWPVGWLLRAQLAIAPKVGGYEELARTISNIKSLMAPHLTHLLTSSWRSLPELTNAEGAHCKDSNPAQSWSTGCLLEVLWELDKIERSLRSSTVSSM
ncbi:glycogen debranching enzyme isoform X2 [Panulirus ornatus]|uniref:glycogen debranching enzyme isoform X2 n=1 Tax=Panulirus ornatus TaxID=150431 RepID=UPI003A84D2C5